LQTLWQPFKKVKKVILTDMLLRKERKWNYIKFLLKIKKGRKKVEDKSRNKEQDNKYKTVTNMVDINPII